MAKKKKSRVLFRVIIALVFAFIAVLIIFNFFAKGQMGVDSLRGVSEWLSNIGNTNFYNANLDDSANKKSKYKFAIVSDSHEDMSVYPKIISQIASRDDLDFMVHLGDQSNAGEEQKLLQSKAVLDTVAAPVYVLPGDHDMNWLPNRDLANFKQVFGLSRTSYSIVKDSERFIFIDNSDGSDGIPMDVWNWLTEELRDASDQNIYVFMSTPISNPYLTFKAMGSQSDKVKKQAQDLGVLLKEHKVKAIFAGDTHTFSQYKDKSTGIPIITSGAAGTNKNPLPLYVVVDILSDGSYNVSSVPLSQ